MDSINFAMQNYYKNYTYANFFYIKMRILMHFLPLDRGFIGVLYWFCAGFKEQKVVTDDSSDSTFYNLI